MTTARGSCSLTRLAALALTALALIAPLPARADTNDAAIVIDVKTGKTLFESNADARRYPASLTKMMTLYVLFEALDKGTVNLSTPLAISANAANQPPSKLDLTAGATISVQNAILAVVTRSANDAAVVIAENLAGSEAAFAARMTATAHALGMSRSTFRNASGLPNPLQSTTARDLSLLGRALQDRFPQYYHFFSTRSFVWQGEAISNHNALLGRIEGVDGIKTGYTRASGFNLVSSVRNGGRSLIAVVMGGATGTARDREMESLIDRYLPLAFAGPRQTPLIGGKGAPIQSGPRAAPPAAAATALVAADAVLPRRKPTDTVTTASVRATALPDPKNGEGDIEDRDPVPALRTTRVAAAPDAAPLPAAPPPAGGWQIQLGALPSSAAAEALLAKARGAAPTLLGGHSPFTEPVSKGAETLYRARFAGFSDKESARATCEKLARLTFACIAVQ